MTLPEDKALAKRVRLAVGRAEMGSSLFPDWRFHVSAGRRRLVVRASGVELDAVWQWDDDTADLDDDQLAEGVTALVTLYLRDLAEYGIDLWPAEA